jgi:glycosyltransferase involved in cell wall biosynthesis
MFTKQADERGVTPSQLQQNGDRARDLRDWAAAVQAYGAYLELRSDDCPIWVQKGNCAKEAKMFEVAENAYLRAISLNQDDHDVHLQLGHLYKMQGLRGRAIAAYKRSLNINPGSAETYRELVGLGEKKAANLIIRTKESDRAKYVLDISDLIFYFRHHPRVSGIQRVQVEIIKHFLQGWRDCAFVQMDSNGALFLLSRDFVKELIDLLDSPDRSVADIVKFTDDMRLGVTPFDLTKPRVYILLGAFWVFPIIPQKMIELRQKGWKVVAYIYDLIPITHSEFCERNLVTQFTTVFYTIAHAVDQILTISEHVKNEVVSKLDGIGIHIPVEAIPLAHELKPSDSFFEAEKWLSEKGLDEPYVLCVGTIEVRKNHSLLFNVWRALQRTRSEPLPKLIFVGRAGWRVGDFMEQLKVTNYCGGRIEILNDLSDDELNALYDGALFTVFPSFEEGWGLPVGESLMHGKLCLASNSSSIPEVGGDFVAYFDPYSVKDATALMERYIDQQTLRKEAEDRLAKEFRPRLWKDVATTFQQRVEARWSSLNMSKPKKTLPPKLEDNLLYSVGITDLDLQSEYDLRGRIVVSCLGSDWKRYRIIWSLGVATLRPCAVSSRQGDKESHRLFGFDDTSQHWIKSCRHQNAKDVPEGQT